MLTGSFPKKHIEKPQGIESDSGARNKKQEIASLRRELAGERLVPLNRLAGDSGTAAWFEEGASGGKITSGKTERRCFEKLCLDFLFKKVSIRG